MIELMNNKKSILFFNAVCISLAAIFFFFEPVNAEEGQPQTEPIKESPIVIVNETNNVPAEMPQIEVPSLATQPETSEAVIEIPEDPDESQNERTDTDGQVENSQAQEPIELDADSDILHEESTESQEIAPNVESPQNEVLLEGETDQPLDALSLPNEAGISSGDPYWTVGKTRYMVLQTGGTCPDGTLETTCWLSDTPISEALNLIEENSWLPTDKKLYVEAGIYAEDILFTGSLLNLMNGLIGVDGSSDTIINGNITVVENLGGFLLSGFTIYGGVSVSESSGTLKLTDLIVNNENGDGIYVNEHLGNVEFSEVISSGNKGAGATIQIGNNSTGTVKVNNSSFDDNGSELTVDEDPVYGLQIQSNSTVIIEGVSASRNNGIGIDVEGNFGALVIKNVVTNQNQTLFTQNPVSCGGGIYVETSKAAKVTLENIQANANSGDGIYVSTLGVVTAKNIEAQYNTLHHGAIYYQHESKQVDRINEFLSDDVDYDEWRFVLDETENIDIVLQTLDGWGFDPVLRLYNNLGELIVEDDNSFDGEWGAQIILEGSSALTAGEYFIRVYRAAGDTASSDYELSVNGEESQITYRLGGNGLSLDLNKTGSVGSVTLVNGVFQQNARNGLDIRNRNAITASSITSSKNGGSGVVLDNAGFLGGVFWGKGNVILNSPANTGWLAANFLNGNNNLGVSIQSKGSIQISNFEASQNRAGGLLLDNCLRDLDTSACMGSGNITINVNIPSQTNKINNNHGIGIDLITKGNVILSNSQVENNQNTGILAKSQGTITMTRVAANDNSSFGAFLDTLSAPIAKSVTISDSEFNDNVNTGLKILSAGAIQLKGVSASENKSPVWQTLETTSITILDQIYQNSLIDGYTFLGEHGEEINIILASDDFDAHLQLLDAYGNSLATDDNGYGSKNAYIQFTLPTDGWFTIKVSDAEESSYGAYLLSINDSNQENPVYPGSGIELDNTSGNAGVTISSTSLNPQNNINENANFGLKILSNGAISIANTGASGNFRDGLFLNNGESKGVVTVQDKNAIPQSVFNQNGGNGIFIQTLGNIILNGVSASGNGKSGVEMDNCQFDDGPSVCLGTGTVSIATKSGYNASFDQNEYFGIRVNTRGNITMSNVSASDNGLDGAYLFNRYLNATGGVTIKALGSIINKFSGNGWNFDAPDELSLSRNGVTIETNGIVTISSANADSNEENGVKIGNSSIPTGKNVVLTSLTMLGNGENGIEAHSKGVISVKNINANGNSLTGALFRNTAGTAGITVTGDSYFNSNGSDGLAVESNGVVVITKVSADKNSGSGLKVDANQANVTINNVAVKNSSEHGLLLTTNGNVTLTGIYCFSNGIGTNGDGVNIAASPNSTIKINTSAFIGNEGNGVEIANATRQKTVFMSVNYFGNDINYEYGAFNREENIYFH